MRRLTYALQFHRPPQAGTAKPGDADPPATASGLSIVTRLHGKRITAELTAVAGSEAVLDASHFLNRDETLFFEHGTITFGGPGPTSSLRFSSIGTGTMLGRPEADGFSHGVVSWKIDGGTGEFEHAGGAIASNFLVNLKTGELIDNHLAVIHLP
jgi:hypothetical protein